VANDSISFELKLVDSVTAIAKKQAAAVKSVETSATKAQDVLGKQFEKIGFAAARAAHKQEQAFAASWAKIGMAAERARQRQEKQQERAHEKAKEHSFLGGIKESTGLGHLTSAAFLGSFLAEGVMKIGETLVESAEKVVDIITDGVKDAFKSAGKEQVQRIGEQISLGSGSKEFREDAERFSGNTGFTSSEIRGLMLPSRNAGMSQAATRQSFSTAADIAAGRGKGGSAEEVGSIMEQFQHIFTKKGIGKKQLVDLLGNVGSTIPDFYKALGKRMHISAKDAEKKSEEGGLDPQMLINMITEAQNKKQGGAAGTGGLQYAKSFEAHWHKIGEIPDDFYRKLVDSPGFARANEMLGHLLEKLDPESPTGQRILGSLNKMFESITDAIGDPETAAEGIADAFDRATKFVAQIVPDLKDVGKELSIMLDSLLYAINRIQYAHALVKGDEHAMAQLAAQQADRDHDRIYGDAHKQANERRELDRKHEIAMSNIADDAEIKAGIKEGPSNAPSNSPNVTVVVKSDSSDPHSHGRQAGRAAARELERARQHGGG
jgi:hypothetical protein